MSRVKDVSYFENVKGNIYLMCHQGKIGVYHGDKNESFPVTVLVGVVLFSLSFMIGLHYLEDSLNISFPEICSPCLAGSWKLALPESVAEQKVMCLTQ